MTAKKVTKKSNKVVKANLTENGSIILQARYLLENETPDDLFMRVAESIAVADCLYDKGITKEELLKDVVYHELDGDESQNISSTLLIHMEDKEEYSSLSRIIDNMYQTLKREGELTPEKKRFYEEFRANSERLWKNDYNTNFNKFIDNLKKLSFKSESVKKSSEKFYNMLVSLDFLPNSPTLMNAGTPLQQLSACFVLPVPDDTRGIYKAITETALIHKSGGGTGFSFSRLRPKNDIVKTTKGVASGPISFMKVFNSSTEEIKQGGKRRGANMGILRIDHPDILEFIDCKKKDGVLNNFNISVAITNEFMEALKLDSEYALINPKNKKVVAKLKAKEVFDKIVKSAWISGDPGVVFIDKINEKNPTPHIAEIESTNPCGEQPLLPYESCNLGSINLSNMVKNHKIDFNHLEEVIYNAVHFLDNVIDVNKYPSRKIEFMTKRNRKIGLGIMGFADMLVKMEIPYDSIEARDIAESVMSFVQRKSRAASMKLAETRGLFPNWKNSIYDKEGENGKYDLKLRNSALTTIAPTGTISTIAGCWGGIEPFFSIAYVKRVMDGTELKEVNPHLKGMLKRRGFLNDKLIDRVAETGTLAGIDEIPDYIKDIFATSHEINYVNHIKMQASFQKYCDSAVSKTINFNNDATEEQIRESYLLAYDLGLKGITVFRDGCKSEQVYYQGSSISKKSAEPQCQLVVGEKKKTPEYAVGTRIRKETGCGKLYVHIYRDEDGKEIEVFADLGKGGGCPSAFTEGVGRMSSLALKHGASIEEIRDELLGIKCPKEKGFGRYYIASCIDGIGKSIHDYIVSRKNISNEKKEVKEEPPAKQIVMPFAQNGACPECGGTLDYVEGCRGGKCRNPACTYFTCS